MARRTTKTSKFGIHSMSSSQVPFSAALTESKGKQIVWSQLRDRIVSALERFPEAREELVAKLSEDLGLSPETRIQL